MQNSLTNITFLRIQGEIDSHFNGKWECKHGTKRDSATINVTVLDTGNSNYIYYITQITQITYCQSFCLVSQQSYLRNCS